MYSEALSWVVCYDFESLIERRRENESRVHVDLTDRFRERLLQILKIAEKGSKVQAFIALFEQIGHSEIQETISPEAGQPTDVIRFVRTTNNSAPDKMLLNADTPLTLSYVEYMVKFEQGDESKTNLDMWIRRYKNWFKRFSMRSKPKVFFGN